MTLIHCALLCEAQSFIEYYKLKKVNSKIYKNSEIVILISGVGKQNTISTLDYMFLNYDIKRAINIGISGCNDTSKEIGSLYCTNQKLENVETLPLITSLNTVTNSLENKPTLYDMEAKYFHNMSLQHLQKNDIFIFKIISDYLSSEILKKDYIKSLIAQQKIVHEFIKLN